MGPIEGARENVRKDPYSLPNGFEWDTVDVSAYLSPRTSLKLLFR